jgi:hypothetical protein
VQPERNPVKDFGKRKATGLKTQIPKAEISARSNNSLESRRCSRAAAPKKGSEEQVLEANLTTEEAFNKQEIKKKQRNDPRRMAVLCPTSPTRPTRQHLPFRPPIRSPAKANHEAHEKMDL